MNSRRRTRIGRLAASEAMLGIDLTKLALYTPNTLPRTICAGGGFNAFNMTSTPKCSADIRGQRNRRGFYPPAYTRPSGHPARGYLVQGRSPGSRVEAPCPSLPKASCLSDLKSDSCSPLTVAGAAPALLRRHGETHRIPVLAIAPYESMEPRTLDIVRQSKFASTDGLCVALRQV